MLAKTPQERWPDLDSAVAAMGGAPLGYHSPVRQKIKALTGATLASIPAVRTGQPSAVSGGAKTLDTATSVSVVGLPPVLETGERIQLQADVKGIGNTSLGGQGVIWASTDPAIAKVDAGWVEALAPGSVSIMASAGNVASSVLLTVQEPKPARVIVRPAAVNMHKGGKIILSALVQDKRGKDLPRPVRWRSSDTSVATVSAKGEVVAKGAGPVTVTAEAEGARGTSAIVVEAPVIAQAPPPPAPAAKAEPPEPRTPEPAAKPKPAPRPAAGGRPIYKHPAAIAASVVLLAATVFGVVSMGGGGEASDPDPVAPTGGAAPPTTPPAGGGAVGGQPAAGQTGSPAASVQQPTGTTTAAGGPLAVTPDPSATDPPPAPTDPQPDAGTSATARGGGPAPSTSARRGGPAPSTPARRGGPAPSVPARVEIGQLASTMQPGGAATATAQVFASSGAAMTGGFRVAWRSSNPRVVAIDQRSGAVRAAGPGAAWIVAMAGGARDSVRVTVAAPATAAAPSPQPSQPVAASVARVVIAGTDLDLVVGSAPQPLTASVLDANGRQVPRPVTWSSSNPRVAAVDGSGRVTAVGAGSAQITATVDGRSDQLGVTVAAAAPAPRPEPAPVASAPRLPSAADARSAVEGYVAALGRNDRDTVTRLWGSAPAGDRGDLLDAMGQRDFRVTLGTVSDPVVDGDGATVTFPLSAAWRSSFGQNRSGNFNFRARFERVGSEWGLASVVLQ
jgi:uncharacterized protein YjdB